MRPGSNKALPRRQDPIPITDCTTWTFPIAAVFLAYAILWLFEGRGRHAWMQTASFVLSLASIVGLASMENAHHSYGIHTLRVGATVFVTMWTTWLFLGVFLQQHRILDGGASDVISFVAAFLGIQIMRRQNKAFALQTVAAKTLLLTSSVVFVLPIRPSTSFTDLELFLKLCVFFVAFFWLLALIIVFEKRLSPWPYMWCSTNWIVLGTPRIVGLGVIVFCVVLAFETNRYIGEKRDENKRIAKAQRSATAGAATMDAMQATAPPSRVAAPTHVHVPAPAQVLASNQRPFETSIPVVLSPTPSAAKLSTKQATSKPAPTTQTPALGSSSEQMKERVKRLLASNGGLVPPTRTTHAPPPKTFDIPKLPSNEERPPSNVAGTVSSGSAPREKETSPPPRRFDFSDLNEE